LNGWYTQFVKQLIFRVLDSTIGTLIRIFQRFLIKSNPHPKDPIQLINEAAMQDSANYAIDNFSTALQFRTIDRDKFWTYCLSKSRDLNPGSIVTLNGNKFPGEAIVAEFGVFKGKSINFFASRCPNAKVYGFDSFLGLEEDWTGWILPAGYFSTNGIMPKCESNVYLYKGCFEDTVPSFQLELKNKFISLLHIDSDTYKPAKYVLNALVKNLKSGSIIIFDEFYGYHGWRSHEYKAFEEFVVAHDLKYKFIAYTGEQVAVEVL